MEIIGVVVIIMLMVQAAILEHIHEQLQRVHQSLKESVNILRTPLQSIDKTLAEAVAERSPDLLSDDDLR